MDMSIFDLRPSFFKIMHHGANSERVVIPKAFMKHISKDLGDVATLKGPSGSCNRVKVIRCDGMIYLQDGWQEFAQDQLLGDSEFIIFRYDGDLCFQVQIFEKNGLRRSAPERSETQIPNQEQHSVVTGEIRARGRPKKFLPVKDDEPKKTDEVKDSPMKAYTCRGFKSCKEVESFTSKYPHAIVRVGAAAVESAHILVLPKTFSRAYLPLRRSNAILKNLKGEIWEVAFVYVQSNRTHTLTKGWIQFARDNNVKAGDICVFELVAELEMMVHILPRS